MIDLEAIRSGLNRGEFFVEYLPTISLAGGNCVGAEALTRWHHESGVVHPFDFVELIQDTALSGRITYWVIETVARELGAWLRANRDAHMAINVPPEILGRGGLEYAATASGLSDLLGSIVLEITEHGVPDAIGVNAINRARQSGIRVALDDVAINNANLLVLSRVNVDIIKLPKSFADSLLDEKGAPANLSGLRALMKATNVQVIAEGVETLRQAELLKEAGVSMAQGWYFSPTLSAERFKAFFHANR
jgi:sensor c-di-GMP phosphodiesterase-like protein